MSDQEETGGYARAMVGEAERIRVAKEVAKLSAEIGMKDRSYPVAATGLRPGPSVMNAADRAETLAETAIRQLSANNDNLLEAITLLCKQLHPVSTADALSVPRTEIEKPVLTGSPLVDAVHVEAARVQEASQVVLLIRGFLAV